jgi:hypothetical protein
MSNTSLMADRQFDLFNCELKIVLALEEYNFFDEFSGKFSNHFLKKAVAEWLL